MSTADPVSAADDGVLIDDSVLSHVLFMAVMAARSTRWAEVSVTPAGVMERCQLCQPHRRRLS